MKNCKMLKIFMILLFFSCFLMTKNHVSYAGTLSSDINGINENQYPGIKSQIQNLQRSHSNYQFKIYYTGIDWTEAVTMEYQGHFKSPKNLFSASGNYQGKWYCPICGSRTYDTGWYCASVDAIKYMMDPRNSLDETSLFQFKNLETADVSNENIQAVINSQYGSYAYINNPQAVNAIVMASNRYGMNGYSILAKIINEQGRGKSPLATGAGYNGQYVGYYNFFNVGAYGNGTSTVILNGLKYASNKGWNSVENSILGGSEYYKSQYIGRGQNTLYYQRFNVVYNPSLFSHQYQQDIMGAQTSATLLKKYYTASNTIHTVRHEYIIPLYENMPRSACARPNTNEQSKAELEDATVLTNKLPVKASPNSTRVISYLNLNEGVKVLERAENVSSDGNYWDTIVSNTDGTYGYVMRSGITAPQNLPIYIFDAQFYADHNGDLKVAFGYDEYKLLKHFLNYGIQEGRTASSTFSVKYYLEENGDLKYAFGNNYQAAYNHFVKYGCNESRRSSPEYDGTFYKYFYRDLTNLSPVALMEHYLSFGKKVEGRIAAIDSTVEKIVFNASLYAECNGDLKYAFGNDTQALRKHWITYGISENRMFSVIFNPEAYRALNGDLAYAYDKNYKKLFEHFIKYGLNEGREASYIFNVKTYANANGDLQVAYGMNYILMDMHFINYGLHEKRATSPYFNIDFYIANNGDLKVAYGTNYKEYYLHYLKYGRNENRKGI